MKPSLLYRISSVLLVLFAGFHTYGLYQAPSKRATVDTVTFLMRTVHFEIMGFTRTFWDFYFGFGMLFTAFLLFSAVLSWQLAVVASTASVRIISWAFAVCFIAVAVLCWLYFFLAPAIVSTAVAVCLALASVQKPG